MPLLTLNRWLGVTPLLGSGLPLSNRVHSDISLAEQ